MKKIYSINPGVRGISRIMEMVHAKFPEAELEPFSQVSLHVIIPVELDLELIDFLNPLAISYTEMNG